MSNMESLAFKSINLDLYKGEFVVLLGSSGAGKSTLLRTINQLNPLTSGELDLIHYLEAFYLFQNIIYKVIISTSSFFSNRSEQSVSISSI